MQRLMTDRYPVYALADIEVESQDISKEDMAANVVAALANWLTRDSRETATIAETTGASEQ